MGRKKKFIDKKKAATFALLYRESVDGEEAGSDRVYTRVDNNRAIRAPDFEDDDDSRFDDAEEDEEAEEDSAPRALQQQGLAQQGLPEHVRRELLEMGFPDDGYNYMKHLRSIGVGGGMLFVPTTSEQSTSLPTDFKAYDASKVRVEQRFSDEGAANTTNLRQIQSARVRVGGLDADIAAVLDDSDLSEDEGDDSDALEDDFILIANQGVEEEAECSRKKDLVSEKVEKAEEIEEDVRSFAAMTINSERISRVIDEQFEVLATKEYDCDIADVEDDADPRARGDAHISEFTAIFDDFLADNPGFVSKPTERAPVTAEAEESKELPIQKTKNLLERSSESEEEAVWVDENDDSASEKWDCETIVSTMSNLDHHPAQISTPGKKRVEFASIQQSQQQVIRIGGKQKLPLEFSRRSDKRALEEHNREREIASGHKGESREEHKARKMAVKDERRASRKAKKELKTRFKAESLRAQVGAAAGAPPAIHL